jgi:kynurenine formamidase
MKAMPEPKQPVVKRDIAVSKQAVDAAFTALSNWGRWGKDDQIGTLNHVTPADVVAAAKLIRRGKVFALGIPLGASGPQRGLFGKRWNPIHTMLATGTDALAGRQDGLLYADDALNMPIQSATHWDSLGHIFYHDKMYNGHHASAVDSNGLSKLGIEHARDKLVGRGVLLDIARYKGVDALKDGEGISNDDLDACAEAQKVTVGKGDFVIIRTGQMEACQQRGEWGGYAGGDAPGLKFESCYWLYEKDLAGVCSDTWGVEVRPNETKDVNQPWHWVVIPAMGLYMGEMFDLKELAEDCALDRVYEFFFCGAPLIIPGGTGSPINPQAIK